MTESIVDLLWALTLLAALGSGLNAGLFFAFSAFVMKALAALPPAAGIAAMQSINVAVLNRVFFAVFFGTAGLSLLLLVVAALAWPAAGAPWLAAGALLDPAGVLWVTVARNVPLNNALAAADPDSAEGAALWRRYCAEWTAWNHVRTVAPLLALAAFVVAACLQYGALDAS